MPLTGATRSHTRSADGTTIGWWSVGDGPAVVLVHGSASHHSTWDALVPHLGGSLHLMDRRGRGESGDGAAYDIARECEDVVAVVEAIGEPGVTVVGHSFGGICATGAAVRSDAIGALVLYEGWPTGGLASTVPAGLADRLDRLVDEGAPDSALETYLSMVAGIDADTMAMLRTTPGWWDTRVAAAHTLGRELRADLACDRDPPPRVDVPTLLIVGGESPAHLAGDPTAVAAALGNARVEALAGEEHLAHRTAPQRFGGVVEAFLADATSS